MGSDSFHGKINEYGFAYDVFEVPKYYSLGDILLIDKAPI